MLYEVDAEALTFQIEATAGRINVNGALLLPHEAVRLSYLLGACAAEAQELARREAYRAKYIAKHGAAA